MQSSPQSHEGGQPDRATRCPIHGGISAVALHSYSALAAQCCSTFALVPASVSALMQAIMQPGASHAHKPLSHAVALIPKRWGREP